jgi:hypothetical protein
MSGENEQHILVMLGEIKGELKGISTLVQVTSDATNRRIDDLNQSVNKRVDELSAATDQRFNSVQAQVNRRGATAGGAGGALVAGAVELIKLMIR